MANFEFPTEVITLPSKGLIYSESNPLSKGSVEIKYMTAREEDILASQNLIKKGVVLDKLFESVVVSEGVSVGDISVGDKNAILLATRILGYGADYNVEVTDPFTGETQKVTIDLAKIQTKEVDDTILNRENRYEFELPISKKKIKFKLLTHKDEIDIIAKHGKLLVFVEVKARKNNYYGYPEEFVNKAKASNIIRAAQNYIITKNWVSGIRFDIIAITGEELVHFEDAFY